MTKPHIYRTIIRIFKKCFSVINYNSDESFNETILEEVSGIIPNNIFDELIKNIFEIKI